MKRISFATQMPGTTPIVLFSTIKMALTLMVLLALPYAPIQAGTVEKIYPVQVVLWGPEINGIRYFWGSDGIHGREPWRTDGTTEGTWMVKDLEVGADDHYDGRLMVTDGTSLYFYASTGSTPSIGIYKSDGTEDGTQWMSDLGRCEGVGALGTNVYAICNLNNTGTRADYSLYRINGGGAEFVKGYALSNWGGVNGDFYHMTSSTGLYFRTVSDVIYDTVWRISRSGVVSEVCDERDNIYCTSSQLAKAGVDSLWWYRGGGLVANGVIIKKDVVIDLSDHKAWGFSGKFFFNEAYYIPSYGNARTPWVSDGTTSGTFPLFSEGTTTKGSVVGITGNKLFFSRSTVDANPNLGELWSTDGTLAGTNRITTDYYAHAGDTFYNPYPEEVTDTTGRVYFSCKATIDGSRDALCRSDGTELGTERLVFSNSWYPKNIVELNGRVLFGAVNAQSFPGDSGNYLAAINPDGPPIQDLEVNIVGNGNVQSDVAGIDCGADCSESYGGGTLLTLTATPAPGEAFIGWEGDIYGWSSDGMDCNIVSCDETSTILTLSMFIDRNITARFSPNTYVVTAEASSFGSISPNTPQIVNSGDTTSFAVTPDSGFNVYEAIGCDGALEGTTYTTGVMNQDCTVSVSFMPPDMTCTTGNSIVGPVTYLDGDTVAELAEGKLNTDGSIMLESGARVIYAATTSVELNKGFRAMNGSMLSAQTKPIECE